MELTANMAFIKSYKKWAIYIVGLILVAIVMLFAESNGIFGTTTMMLLYVLIVISVLLYTLMQSAQEIAQLNKSLTEKNNQLKAVNDELEGFSYSVSHDLRAPLRAINGFSNMLEENYGDKLEEDATRLVGVIRESSLTMGKLIDDLLKFSRTGRKAMSIEKVDMNEVVHAAIAETTLQNPELVNIIKAETLPYVFGDKQMVQQVYTNLLANAIKFSSKKEQPFIEVGIEQNGSNPVFFVKDNGVGFDKRYSNNLFGVFQRLHGQKEFPGTGMGLALSKRIITKHGGEIWADAEIDKGATFYFTLPLKN